MQIIEFDYILRLITAATFGGLIGIERQIQGQTAGFRTQLLVCLGSCLFTITSFKFLDFGFKVVDPSRIAAQIVVGIGFLGAGAIIKQGEYIRGLTTAATLWIVSAIGLTIGIGDYILAAFTTFLTMINLIILKKLENIMPKDIYVKITLEYEGSEFLNLEPLSKSLSIVITNQKVSLDKEHNIITVTATAKYKNNNQMVIFLNKIKENPSLKKILVE